METLWNNSHSHSLSLSLFVKECECVSANVKRESFFGRPSQSYGLTAYVCGMPRNATYFISRVHRQQWNSVCVCVLHLPGSERSTNRPTVHLVEALILPFSFLDKKVKCLPFVILLSLYFYPHKIHDLCHY